VKSDIPAGEPVSARVRVEELSRAQARVDQLLEALRRETARLGPDDDSALQFDPGQPE